MKKTIRLSRAYLIALSICAIFSCAKEPSTSGSSSNGGNNSDNENGEYVDLGLPSGTKWKLVNEENAADSVYNFFTHDEAVDQFGNKLPTKEQYEELITSCSWTWKDNGYKVTGPNGDSIFLPATGYRSCFDHILSEGSVGGYRSSTPYDQ